MADLINLTPQQSITVNVASTNVLYVPSVSESIDVSRYDILDLELAVLGVPSGSPNIVFQLLTSMQNQYDDLGGLAPTTQASWISAGSINGGTGVSSAPTYNLKTFTTGFLRYVRWGVYSTSLTGNVTFWCRGLARSYACSR